MNNMEITLNVRVAQPLIDSLRIILEKLERGEYVHESGGMIIRTDSQTGVVQIQSDLSLIPK